MSVSVTIIPFANWIQSKHNQYPSHIYPLKLEARTSGNTSKTFGDMKIQCAPRDSAGDHVRGKSSDVNKIKVQDIIEQWYPAYNPEWLKLSAWKAFHPGENNQHGA